MTNIDRMPLTLGFKIKKRKVSFSRTCWLDCKNFHLGQSFFLYKIFIRKRLTGFYLWCSVVNEMRIKSTKTSMEYGHIIWWRVLSNIISKRFSFELPSCESKCCHRMTQFCQPHIHQRLTSYVNDETKTSYRDLFALLLTFASLKLRLRFMNHRSRLVVQNKFRSKRLELIFSDFSIES